MVLRDSNREILKSKIVRNEDILSMFAAKAIACVQVVTLSNDLGLTMVEIEGDTLLVVKKVQSDGVDRLEIGAYIKDAKH
ncbi:hypothetical protein Gorai_013061 [Gossypium raimondii]|uniref:RNase H type-1 domain-containing protein n=1 Tax=Gossypium raimondii TaxID=29730 RepID=A0A0D2UWH8_GOSRA|nr:hypothetical protein B456_009G306400 [Gossypium raimondii]KJB60470.1 hypothetical protein B456_009G306400 [Gossypium raimondii]MBA0596232.1 hypothetical protein [Gossypium raimondii]